MLCLVLPGSCLTRFIIILNYACRPDYSPFSKKITRMRIKPRKKFDKLKKKTKEKLEKLRKVLRKRPEDKDQESQGRYGGLLN